MGLAMWHYCWTVEKYPATWDGEEVVSQQCVRTVGNAGKTTGQASDDQRTQNGRLGRMAFTLDSDGETERWICQLAVLLDSEERNSYAVV